MTGDFCSSFGKLGAISRRHNIDINRHFCINFDKFGRLLMRIFSERGMRTKPAGELKLKVYKSSKSVVKMK